MTKDEAKIELVELLFSQLDQLIIMAKSVHIEISNDLITELREIKDILYDSPDVSDVLINGLYSDIIDLTTILKLDLGDDVLNEMTRLRKIIDDTNS